MKRPILIALLVIGVIATMSAAQSMAADHFPELAISKNCRALLERTMYAEPAEVVLGHLFYAKDPITQRGACGWSSNSAWQAYDACRRKAEAEKITGACLPLIRHSTILARTYDEAKTRAGGWEFDAGADPWRCGQEPASRYFWLEHGYCDLPRYGPERAQGLVIWNHGIAGTIVQHTAPPALAIRLLQTRGWDVLALKRNNLGEDGASYRRAEGRVVEEIRAQRARGYRKIIVAGQSFGGRLALEIARAADDVFAANTRDQGPTDQRLTEAKVERLVVVYPANDMLFGNVDRGRTSRVVLARRARPYLLLDESAGLSGHGGAGGGTFAMRYGLCLARFLSAADVPAGRFECHEASDGLEVTRELLPPPAERDAGRRE